MSEALNELCIAMGRLKAAYVPRDRQLLEELMQDQRLDRAQAILRMSDLARGLVIKIYTEASRADDQWTDEEQQIGAYLIGEFWNQQLSGNDLRKAWGQLMQDANKLRWDALVQPFARYPSLRRFQSEVFTVGVHIANIVIKADGMVQPAETRALIAIEKELERAIFQQIPQAIPVGSDSPVGQTNPASTQPEPTSLAPDNGASSSEVSLEESMQSLEKLIGLRSVKQKVHELASFLQMQQQRIKLGLPASSHALHMTFSGNPGTGKTTVARILAHIMQGIGVLKKGHLVETDRSGLVAEYAGQTAIKTDKKIAEALDGVLFIDEAYSLIDSSGDDAFGREAIQTLLKRMEDQRSRLIVILAGYTGPLDDMLKSNPGLSSRVGANLEFPDYEPNELMAIYRMLCREHQYVMGPDAEVLVLRGLVWLYEQRDEHFGNGRTVRNAFELTIRKMAIRIAPLSPVTHALLTTLHVDDIAFPGVDADSWREIMSQPISAKFRCPDCEQRITGTDQRILQQQDCPKCGGSLALERLSEVQWVRQPAS